MSENGGAISTYEFFEQFPNEQAAIDFLEAERWPDGAICPRCESARTKRISTSNRHNCNACRKQFTVRTGSIFERSHIPLHKWLYTMYLMQTARKGISSVQLGKELGITQNSAWFLLHRLREVMHREDVVLDGEVEIDETYVGGLEKEQTQQEKTADRWRDWGEGDRARLPPARGEDSHSSYPHDREAPHGRRNPVGCRGRVQHLY